MGAGRRIGDLGPGPLQEPWAAGELRVWGLRSGRPTLEWQGRGTRSEGRERGGGGGGAGAGAGQRGSGVGSLGLRSRRTCSSGGELGAGRRFAVQRAGRYAVMCGPPRRVRVQHLGDRGGGWGGGESVGPGGEGCRI